MGAALYVKRETTPSVIPGDEVMFLLRDKGSVSATPRIYIKAIDPGTTWELRWGRGPMVDSFTSTYGPFAAMGRGEVMQVGLNNSSDDPVHVVRCLTGRLAVTVVSPQDVQMQFRTRGRKSA